MWILSGIRIFKWRSIQMLTDGLFDYGMGRLHEVMIHA
jgi:hypothetical protein